MRILTKLGRFEFVGTKFFPSAKAKGINQGSLRDKKQPTPDINNKIDVLEETSNKKLYRFLLQTKLKHRGR